MPAKLLIWIPPKATSTIVIEKILTPWAIFLNPTVVKDKYIVSEISSQSNIAVNVSLNEKVLFRLLESIVYLLRNSKTFTSM